MVEDNQLVPKTHLFVISLGDLHCDIKICFEYPSLPSLCENQAAIRKRARIMAYQIHHK